MSQELDAFSALAESDEDGDEDSQVEDFTSDINGKIEAQAEHSENQSLDFQICVEHSAGGTPTECHYSRNGSSGRRHGYNAAAVNIFHCV